MHCTKDKVGDIAVVTISAEQVDGGNADDVKREVMGLLGDARKLVLDLRPVRFLDSRGCGVLLSCLKHMSSVGGDLKLCGVSESVRMILELIRLHKVCDIKPNREAAVAAFSAAPGSAPAATGPVPAR
jgi:anti-sigma B factor antagonist